MKTVAFLPQDYENDLIIAAFSLQCLIYNVLPFEEQALQEHQCPPKSQLSLHPCPTIHPKHFWYISQISWDILIRIGRRVRSPHIWYYGKRFANR